MQKGSHKLRVPFPRGFSINYEIKKDISEKIYYLDKNIQKHTFDEEGCIVFYEGNNREKIFSEISNLVKDIFNSYRGVNLKILFHNNILCELAEDPTRFFFETGQLFFSSPGTPILLKDLAKLSSSIDFFIEKVAKNLESRNFECPTTVPYISLLKSGYLKSFPQHIMAVGSVHHNFDSLKSISELTPENDKVERFDPLIGEHNQILSPTVCAHCFEILKNSQIIEENLIYTAKSKCSRHEGKNYNSLARLQTYTMREIIFFGSALYVKNMQENLLDFFKETFKDWELNFRVIVATDPFFTAGNEKLRIFQSSLNLKYELQLFIPHDESWLAIASFNHHRDSLVNPYDISYKNNNAKLNSGCFGLGFERLIYGLYCQKGKDIHKWPMRILKDLLLK